ILLRCAAKQAFADAALAIGRIRDLGYGVQRSRARAGVGGTHAVFRPQLQTGDGEEIVVGNFVRAGNIAAEEVLKGLPRDLLDSGADALATVVEPALLGILDVHTAENVIERLVVVSGVADREIEHDPENLAFVVIRDAAVRDIVGVVFLKPGVEAGLLDTLPLSRRAGFELADLRSEIRIELSLRPQTGA